MKALKDNKIVKIYFAPRAKENRETLLIHQGLINNPKVKLVDSEKESDFVFLFYYASKHCPSGKEFPPEKTILIDYHDKADWVCPVKCLVYFKRSWVNRVNKDGYTISVPISWPANFYPLTMAIMDEFIVHEKIERDYTLSCSLRKVKRHYNRRRVLALLERMHIQGKVQIGEFNQGTMFQFNAPDMRDYFRLLRRSRIVVTCNPGKWEGDHRTWEAFAGGALIFVDRTLAPLIHPLIDGEHCIFYDLSDEGLRELQKKILYYMNHQDEAEIIAHAGYIFTMKYHRSSNRIDKILEVIT